RVIREGRAVTSRLKSPMPAFSVGEGSLLSPAQAEVWAQLKEETQAAPKQQGPLTAAQVQVLAGGIKKRWGPPASLPGSVPPYLAPAAGRTDSKSVPPSGGNKNEDARVARGRTAFARACGGCHGKEGKGVERDGRLRRKINDPTFLALI